MTLSEIKKEALRLMFATEDASIDLDEIEGVDDYLDKMDGAVDRAIMRICQAKKAGIKRLTITSDDFEDLYIGLDLTTIDSDANIMQIDRVAIKPTDYPLQPYNAFYTLDYKTLVFEEELDDDNTVYVYYYPSIVDLDDLREDVQRIIPYFIKADLFEEDEAEISMAARNLFEGYLANIEMGTQTIQPQVSNVFGGFNY